ncbi:hypothetical protein NL676_017043 [Syzygium grande]|nr:hypothetical protein NL676_017043 [Syzygium grande]
MSLFCLSDFLLWSPSLDGALGMLNLSIFLELLVFKMNCKDDTKWTRLCAQTGFEHLLRLREKAGVRVHSDEFSNGDFDG